MLHELKGLNMAKRVNCTEYLKNKLYKIYKKTVAFTLAETLIVMGVIGVVAALTLPNLNQSTGNKEKVAKVKKIYQNLNDAFGRATAVYGPYDEWFINDSTLNAKTKRAGERITEFMKLTKNCGMNTGQGCLRTGDNNTSIYKFITADGMSVALDINQVYVDIDGPTKGNDKDGYDNFNFEIEDDGIYPIGHDYNFLSLMSINQVGTAMFHAAAWIIKYDNMDYLKIDNGKCPNGTTPTEENPRCN